MFASSSGKAKPTCGLLLSFQPFLLCLEESLMPFTNNNKSQHKELPHPQFPQHPLPTSLVIIDNGEERRPRTAWGKPPSRMGGTAMQGPKRTQNLVGEDGDSGPPTRRRSWRILQRSLRMGERRKAWKSLARSLVPCGEQLQHGNSGLSQIV